MLCYIRIVNPVVFPLFKNNNSIVAKLYAEIKPWSLNSNIMNTAEIYMGWKLLVIVFRMEYLPDKLILEQKL